MRRGEHVDADAEDDGLRGGAEAVRLRRECRRACAGRPARSFGHFRSAPSQSRASIAVAHRDARGERQERQRAVHGSVAARTQARTTDRARRPAASSRRVRAGRARRSARRRRPRVLRLRQPRPPRAATSIVDVTDANARTREREWRPTRAAAMAAARSPGIGATWPSVNALELEAEVGGAHRVRQRADRHEVGAGGGDLGQPLERHAAGDLDERAPAAAAHRFALIRRARSCRRSTRVGAGRQRLSSSSSVSTSTSTGSADAAAARAAPRAMPPASRLWLSLIRTPSSSRWRWFVPPPQRTAYFSRSRNVGVVFRVSRTVMRPAAASTYVRVSVAMPLRRCRKLSAVRSAVEQRPRPPEHLGDDGRRVAALAVRRDAR